MSLQKMPARPVPPLERLYYEEEDPKDLWGKCIEFQKRWDEESLTNPKMFKSMDYFKKHRAINLVWMSDRLEGTMPEGASKFETYHTLVSIYDGSPCSDTGLQGSSVTVTEDDRKSCKQLVQHMKAYYLIEKAKKESLSVDLILDTHRTLMEGLCNDGKPVTAGEYRRVAVYSDDHQYPDYHCIPVRMPSIVREYNTKFSDPDHDPYQLASWLLYEVISLHPFEDGNGRLCRLLWCYSLMRDGLPFPTVLTSGHTKAYKHYIDALKKSCRVGPRYENHPHLTSLTVLSVYLAWNNFYRNWDGHEKQ